MLNHIHQLLNHKYKSWSYQKLKLQKTIQFLKLNLRS